MTAAARADSIPCSPRAVWAEYHVVKIAEWIGEGRLRRAVPDIDGRVEQRIASECVAEMPPGR